MKSNAEVSTLTGLFSSSVGRYPDRPAVSDEHRTLTYAELDHEANALSTLLRSRGVGVEDRVGVYIERSVDLFVAILGVLKSGAAYVAVDTRYPDVRRDLMLRKSGAKVILTEAGWEDRLVSLSAEVISDKGLSASGSLLSECPVSPENAASILFTSGSSGEPKAIVLEHRNITSFMCNLSLPPFMPQDRTGQVSSVSFDAFHYEMWKTIDGGGHTVVLPSVPDLLAKGFQSQMKEYGITTMVVPTMVVNDVVRDDPEAFASLRFLGAGGDVLLPSACLALHKSSFDGLLYNLYGPAETTNACTVHRVTLEDAQSDTIPIGRPIEGMSVQVLAPDLTPVPIGQIGELFVSGPGVARGYQDREDLTAERFLLLPTDEGVVRTYRTGDLVREQEGGTLEFIGRADNQLKIRGYRVEPGEVERGLRRYDEVQDAVVLADGEGGKRRLVAFLVLEERLALDELRERALRDLPDFMVPSQFIIVSEIPVTVNGKRDMDSLRDALSEKKEGAALGGASETEDEQYLVELWRELLDIDQVGRNDHFIENGGHSLLAFRMQQRIYRDLGVRLKLPEVLERPVLKDLASAVGAARDDMEMQ